MASVVETQRLISVSLGKIAHSRAQRGGINLHKNLLVASVLNRARTAFMMDNYNHQMSLQQRQLQHQQQIVLSTPQPSPVCNSVSPANDSNSLSSLGVKTCQPTPDVESRSSSSDTQVSSELVSGESVELNMVPIMNDKENVSPSAENTVSSSVVDNVPSECKQDSVSGEQHIEAACQLSNDAQLAGQNTPFSSCKQTSSSLTCSSVLKRRRDNPETPSTNETDCPVNKKARVSSSDCSYLQTCDISSSSCGEYESDSESAMQTDSPQITNLVTIFNSGFSGLCVSPSPSSCNQSSHNNTSYQQDSSSVNHHWSSSSRKVSDNQQPLHCSSQVERIGALSSAIVLSA